MSNYAALVKVRDATDSRVTLEIRMFADGIPLKHQASDGPTAAVEILEVGQTIEVRFGNAQSLAAHQRDER